MDHYNQYYANRFTSKSASTPLHPSTAKDGEPKPRNFIARYERCSQTIQNELEAFFALSAQHFSSCNPIQWWYSHRDEFPNLYRLAKDILAIPGNIYSYSTSLIDVAFRICRRCWAHLLRWPRYHFLTPSKLEAKHDMYAHDTETTYPNAPCLMSLNSSENKFFFVPFIPG